jgi:hypothetical protein
MSCSLLAFPGYIPYMYMMRFEYWLELGWTDWLVYGVLLCWLGLGMHISGHLLLYIVYYSLIPLWACI